jgi:hypothetical protein
MAFVVSVGCGPAGAPAEATVTYYQDVAPVLVEKCGGCHVSGGIGPFALDSYDAAAPMAGSIADSVAEGRMPPWGAEESEGCTPQVPWKEDARLTEEQKQTLAAWADQGAPEGDPAAAAALPMPPALDLEDPTMELYPSEAYTPEVGGDVFMCYSFDPELTDTKWLTGLQIVPGDLAVVHHVLVSIDSTGATAAERGWYSCSGGGLGGGDQLIGVWAPGGGPLLTPEGTGTPLDAGVRIVMQVHYHPAHDNFGPDSTGFTLRLQDTAPARTALVTLIGNAGSAADGLLPGDADSGQPVFKIPADTAGHVEAMDYVVPEGGPYALFQVATHMHYVGVDMLAEVEHAAPQGSEPATECLVQTPHWDFNWQRSYVYDAAIEDLPQVRGGDTIHLRCTYDNVLTNPGVQQALEDAGKTETSVVRLGETTLDEMCLIAVGVVLPE